MRSSNIFSWAVIGAGPGGITAVGLLLDQGVSARDIVWIDPYFRAGDFGRLWGEVNSNTRVSLFQQYLKGIVNFHYDQRPAPFTLDTLTETGFTILHHVTEPLLWVSRALKQRVSAQQTWVASLSMNLGYWEITTSESKCYYAEKVILATGAEPNSLHHPGLQPIHLATALTPSQLRFTCQSDDIVAVFGSSHSAMIAIRNLIEVGVQRIINFYLSPVRFAVLMDDWIFYDDSGLKGETAAWVKQHILKQPLSQIQRYLVSEEHLNQHLPLCNKVIDAIGFQTRQIPIQGVSLSQYDETNGIIAPGLFGVGIGFPLTVTDPFGRKEYNVGLWKFLKNMQRTLPIWQRYGFH